jgi:catechol 2,3-dioxygenase-like lactoylglutathione lyase family enzyme
MIADIDALVTSYERGRLTRRQLLQSIALLVAPARAAAQGPAGGLSKGRNLHHVNLQVSDLARSEAFYRRLFDLPPSRRVQGPDNHGFDLPGAGLFILQKSDGPGRLDHFCVGVDEFDADRMRTAIRAAGIGAVQGNAIDSFIVSDPDGIRVQISSPDWSA